ncbi:hypothetical protein [Cohnella soli]|uniref:Spore coat protein B n=1 Tax=Cohnella soli TaxID=425005 RepID=A0ABW0HWZ1_9BACL
MFCGFWQPSQPAPQVQPRATMPAPRPNVSQPRPTPNVMNAQFLIGKNVRINRGGPDSVQGVLVATPANFLVVLSEGVIVFVNGIHVKSITEGVSGGRSGGKSGGRSGGKSGGRSGGRSHGFSGHKSIITASSFHGVLTRLRHKHIQINRGGPEKLDGFLAEVSSNEVLLIVNRELVRIPIFHIKNVSLSLKSSGNKSGGNKNNNNKSNNKKSSGGNKSSGGKSGNNKRSGGSRGNRGGKS